MDAHRRELGLEDNGEYPLWRLHPSSPGCPLTKGDVPSQRVEIFISFGTSIIIFFY